MRALSRHSKLFQNTACTQRFPDGFRIVPLSAWTRTTSSIFECSVQGVHRRYWRGENEYVIYSAYYEENSLSLVGNRSFIVFKKCGETVSRQENKNYSLCKSIYWTDCFSQIIWKVWTAILNCRAPPFILQRIDDSPLFLCRSPAHSLLKYPG